MKNNYLICSLLFTTGMQNAWGVQATNHKTNPDKTKPNIILILCDDMGFSDLSCYGGEVHTPNIDFLAENGIRFSQFKNTGRSCPSRAALLTGRYQHEVGMGWMTAVDEHRPGYRGQISEQYPTIAEVFRENGYHTYMSGKWHVTVDGAFSKPNGSYPVERGFENTMVVFLEVEVIILRNPYIPGYSILQSFQKTIIIPQPLPTLPLVLSVSIRLKSLCLCIWPTMPPHLPLQAPKERVDACRERYKVGYDVLRKQRFERIRKNGLTDSEKQLPVFEREFRGKRPAWDSLTPQQQERWITEMATYAAMIEIMDDGIGEVIKTTKEKGIFDNTVFLFLSDNGATNEGDLITQLRADLSNTPFRSYKQWCFQGRYQFTFDCNVWRRAT